MRVYIAADHAGYELKNHLVSWMKEHGHDVTDCGPFVYDAQDAGSILRAYRLYLSGCAMCFEQGWVALHQVLATRPDGRVVYPFTRDYMYR